MFSTSKPYDIAKELVNIYLQMDRNDMTPEQEMIINDLETCSDNDDGRRNGKVDYFYKRINNINKTFMLNKTIIDKNPDIIMPRPVFDIFKYDDSGLINFLKVLIESNIKENNRKDKHNLYKKTDIDKDSSEVVDIINKISDKKYKTFEYIESNYEIDNLEGLWLYLDEYVDSKWKDRILDCFLKNPLGNTNYKFIATVYTETWKYCFKNFIKDFKNGNDNLHIKFQDSNPLYPIIEYKIIWNLWIRIINRIFQQICIRYYKKEDSINNLIDTLNLLIQEAETDRGMMQKEKSIADGYYKYYYMLEISSKLNMELICLNFINKENIFLREEDLFVDEKNEIKTEFSNIDEVEINELNKLFNVGQKCTKKNTFETRLKFCKDFIPIYNNLAYRKIKENDIRNLRAVYRALFINKITYKRLSTYGIAKKIIELFEKTKEYNTNTLDSPDKREIIHKNILNDIYKEDINLKKHHFILGNAISNAILSEQIYGYNTMKSKCGFLEVFYKLALLIFYRDCPGMDASQEEVINALNKIEYNFDKILKEVLKIIEYNS